MCSKPSYLLGYPNLPGDDNNMKSMKTEMLIFSKWQVVIFIFEQLFVHQWIFFNLCVTEGCGNWCYFINHVCEKNNV